ncbi:MAG TPA: phosphoglucosamine mutase, partial [Candidatus Hydrogenedentes bacterium]|nr:phosphoglucosamine mutase [Candidatus Hydrogenedentota bacterium]
MVQTQERRSISGIRGTAETFPPSKAADYTKAFATLLREIMPGNTVLAGMDTRPASGDYAVHVIESLREAGWDVVDLGIVPTPTVQIAI